MSLPTSASDPRIHLTTSAIQTLIWIFPDEVSTVKLCIFGKLKARRRKRVSLGETELGMEMFTWRHVKEREDPHAPPTLTRLFTFISSYIFDILPVFAGHCFLLFNPVGFSFYSGQVFRAFWCNQLIIILANTINKINERI